MKTSDWPPSNYPICLALVLLVATAVILAIGDETLAEELSILAYYLLVIGVLIRFIEISLPDTTPQKIESARRLVIDLIDKIMYWIDENMPSNIISIINDKVQQLLKFTSTIKLKIKFNVKAEQISTILYILKAVTINLSVVFLAILIYGSFVGWWIVRGYLVNLALIIIGIFTLYIFIRISGRKSRI